MHAVEALIAGVRGAENGTVTFFLRGTTLVSDYYADFEATQLLPGQSVLLDSFGSLTAYVAELVDVVVKNDLGVVVREFVAGAEDAAVEVISPSFTGTDYVSGASGTQKPTNLARVLDAWFTSAGAPDWKVDVGGTPTSLETAIGLAAATFFNVKTYGAQGNGLSDDTAAITAAVTAAVAAGGGVVFFPPGVYRITSGIALPGSVHFMGSGGLSSKLAMDGANPAIVPGTNAVGSISNVTGLWVGGINVAGSTAIGGNYGATGEFHFTDCVFANDAFCGRVYDNGTSLAACKTVFTRCFMRLTVGNTTMIRHLGAGQLTVRDCDLISVQTISGVFVMCDDNGVISGNRFDDSAATLGSTSYIRIAPATDGGVRIFGNHFAPNFAFPPVAILNALATPNRDAMEYGNVFGNVALGPFGIIPYDYSTDGYAAIVSTLPSSGHGSRPARIEGYVGFVAAAVSVNPKAYGTTTIERTVGAALTVNANRGSMGDRWTLFIDCTPGVTVTAGTNIIFSAAFVVPPLTRLHVELAWLPLAGGIVGRWRQVSQEVIA